MKEQNNSKSQSKTTQRRIPDHILLVVKTRIVDTTVLLVLTAKATEENLLILQWLIFLT